ncbi:MAG: hypothetical protein BGP15_15250 [Sphingobacterium sp. 40-24]|uniref:DUF416 family protein n=1 Tax=Sphingobacterium sp. 40-24 TaxID=1895843 RepID=UPI00095A43AA|nr:DUF416 family protein [Sphingobacterium sp. 40-24]OJZ14799.1 MAG: hypothetical protein BGP15_15250 [Sphingobacterium sp. 40-24]
MSLLDISKLKTLGHKKQLTFAYLACERMFPNTAYFIELENFGDLQSFKKGIDLVYRSIFGREKTLFIEVDSVLNSIYNSIPSTTDFPTPYGTLALYSGSTIHQSVCLIKNNDTDKLLEEISTSPINAIDLYIQERDDMDYDDPQFEQKITNDPLMQTEINLQSGIIQYLSKIDFVTSDDVNTLLNAQVEQTIALKF